MTSSTPNTRPGSSSSSSSSVICDIHKNEDARRRRRASNHATDADHRRCCRPNAVGAGASSSLPMFVLTFLLATACLISTSSAFTTTRAPRFSMARGLYNSRGVQLSSPPEKNLPTAHRLTPLPRSSSTSLSAAAGGGKSDKLEWRALLAALQLYKAAYGDVMVPARFVVPAKLPWPEATWDLKLGKQVASIRITGKYVATNESRRTQLEKIGFVWEVRSRTAADIPFDQVYEALQVYRKLVQPDGELSIPLRFSVPDEEPWPESTRGIPLGRCFKDVTAKPYIAAHPEVILRLQSLGAVADASSVNDVRFQNVFDALVTYKKVYGDLSVPQPFSVPVDSKDWPENTWGLRLGARVNAIRSQGTFLKGNEERRAMLNDIGFLWGSFPKASSSRPDNANDPASGDDSEEDDLETFVSSFDFSDKEEDDRSSTRADDGSSWGYDESSELSKVVAAAREEQQGAQNAKEEDYVEPPTLADSLAVAKKRALDTGVLVEGESGFLRKGKRDYEIPWYNDDFGTDFVFEDVVEALTLFKSFYGNFANFTTNFDFVIPLEVSEEPAFDLDGDFDDDVLSRDPSVRAAAAVARFGRLDGAAASEETEEESLTATATLTPVKEVEWPEHLGGMNLGNIVGRIRDGSLEVKHLPERKKQLDAIDFDWGDPKHFIDIPFEKTMCALFAYYLVRGDSFVTLDFVMPDEMPWPQALAGFEIGVAVKRLRELQNFFEAFHEDKLMLLRMVDFVWFPSLADPIDPNEPEMNPERLRLSAMGHPDYSLLPETDQPMGLADKIFADGPFYETDDPKLWWRKWHNWDYVEDLWYQRGRRDNALWLRNNGFEEMAQEHEDKYGPGFFTQLGDTLDLLNNEDKTPLSPEEKGDIFIKLNYYRGELVGCTDLPDFVLENINEGLDERIDQLEQGIEDGTVMEMEIEEYEEELVEDESYDEEEVEEEFEEEEEGTIDEVTGETGDDVYEEEEVDSQEGEEEGEDDELDITEELGLG